MKSLKYALTLIVTLILFALLCAIADYMQLSSSVSVFWGFVFALVYVAADKKIFKDW